VKVKNSVWYLADKGGRALLNLVVFAWVSRAMGPEGLGWLGVGLAWMALTSGLGVPALEAWLIAQWPKTPQDDVAGVFRKAFWTHTVLTGGALVLVGLAGMPGWGLGILAASGLFRSSDAFRTYLEAHGQARRTVLFEGVAFVVGVVAKMGCVWADAAWGWYALAFALEPILAWPLLWRAVRPLAGISLREVLVPLPDAAEWGAFVRQILPQILAFALFLGQLRLGTLLLEAWSTPAEVGHWTAALRLLEIWSFVPWALTATLYPAAVRAQPRSKERRGLIQQMALRSLGSAAVLALPLSVGAAWGISAVYGPDFADAAPVLRIAAFNLFPWFAYLFWTRWMHVEQLGNRIPVFAGVYVLLQALLAFLWIPDHGAIGAAWASVLSGAIALAAALAVSLGQKGAVHPNSSPTSTPGK
jgi:PST family polysaccharide transporter